MDNIEKNNASLYLNIPLDVLYSNQLDPSEKLMWMILKSHVTFGKDFHYCQVGERKLADEFCATRDTVRAVIARLVAKKVVVVHEHARLNSDRKGITELTGSYNGCVYELIEPAQWSDLEGKKKTRRGGNLPSTKTKKEPSVAATTDSSIGLTHKTSYPYTNGSTTNDIGQAIHDQIGYELLADTLKPLANKILPAVEKLSTDERARLTPDIFMSVMVAVQHAQSEGLIKTNIETFAEGVLRKKIAGSDDQTAASAAAGSLPASRPAVKKNGFHNFSERRDYDYDDLEKKLRNRHRHDNE